MSVVHKHTSGPWKPSASGHLGHFQGDAAAAGPGTMLGETDLVPQWENHGKSCVGLVKPVILMPGWPNTITLQRLINYPNLGP